MTDVTERREAEHVRDFEDKRRKGRSVLELDDVGGEYVPWNTPIFAGLW